MALNPRFSFEPRVFRIYENAIINTLTLGSRGSILLVNNIRILAISIFVLSTVFDSEFIFVFNLI